MDPSSNPLHGMFKYLEGVVTALFWPALHFWPGALHPPPSRDYPLSLLFVIPLLTTIFAPTRTFSGPFRYGYLEYTPKLSSFLATLFGIFTSLPNWAIAALFLLPFLPILLFFLIPVLPLAWHHISHHYRLRLKDITAFATRTNTRLDIAIARAERAAALAHTYEEQALNTASTTRTAALTLTLHSTDFFDTAVSAWSALDSTTASAQKVAAAARNVVDAANDVLQGEFPDNDSPDEEGGDEESQAEILAKILLDQANEAFKTASEAERLAHEAQKSVEQSKNAETRSKEVRQQVDEEAKRVCSLGIKLAEKVVGMEKKVANIKDEAEKARGFLEDAVAIAVEGDMAAAEKLKNDATEVLESVVQQADALGSIADEARQAWVKLLVDTKD